MGCGRGPGVTPRPRGSRPWLWTAAPPGLRTGLSLPDVIVRGARLVGAQVLRAAARPLVAVVLLAPVGAAVAALVRVVPPPRAVVGPDRLGVHARDHERRHDENEEDAQFNQPDPPRRVGGV